MGLSFVRSYPCHRLYVSDKRKDGVKVRIGTYDVTQVTKDSVMVGCQRVTRAEIQEVLKQMDNPFEIHIGVDKVGGVYLQPNGKGEVNLRIKGLNHEYGILTITKEGIKLWGGCAGCGLPTEDFKTHNTVKIQEETL